MIVDVKVPAAGESISEGVLLEWHPKSGDLVQADDPLFELETDKITMTVAAETAGQITIQVEVGERVVMGQVVATLDTEKTGATGKTGKASEVAAPAPAAVGDKATASGGEPERVAAEVTTGTKAAATTGGTDGTSPAIDPGEQSPSVRRMLAEYQIQPGSITPTGKDGRITKEDVVKVLNAGDVAAAGPATPTPAGPATPTPAAGPASGGPAGEPPAIAERQTRQRMTPLRKRVAERLVKAQQTAAILTTFNECDMSAVMALRKRHQESFEKKHGVRLGFMSFFVKAVVDALQRVPRLNAQIDGDDIVQNHFYDIGVAVGTEQGLVVPVIRDADRLGFAEIERVIGDFAERARTRKLELGDLTGGCYTISNGGVYGSLLSTPILNPPQSGILGLHAIKKRPVAVDDRVEIRPMMYLAQSYDHRLVDGSEAVTFLKRVVECIENPERMMLDI
jgi:2-oxoglutarate dehydrogenase E2 component (dihydrolipoamide succinyltransferase)